MKNIVIIGSGLGGLMAGANFAKNGHSVTIIEKHMIVGGYASNFMRKAKSGEKVTFDVSLHGIGDFLPNRLLYNATKDIGILDDIGLIRKKETATLVEKDGSYTDIPDNFLEYKALLIKKYPNEEKGINSLFDFIHIISEEMSDLDVDDIPKSIYLSQDINLYDFLKQYVDDDNFIDDFSFLWLYYGLPSKEINAYYYLVAWCSYHIGGTFYIKGGGGALSSTIANFIKNNGGNIVLKEEVIKLNTDGKKILSVETDKGKTFKGDYFIINGCLENVLNCVDNKNTITSYIDNVKKRPESISLSQLYVGLDCDPTTLGIDKSDLFYLNNKTAEKNYEFIKNGDYENTPYGIVNYNLLDSSLNKDTGFLCITIGDFEYNWAERGTDEYIKQKERVTNILLDKLYEHFPKTKDHVIITELGTPKTMKRYTLNKNGAVYGFAQDTKNGGFNRLGYKTAFENGYIASAWTQPGGGYQGAMLAGYFCSNIVLNDIKNIDNRTIVLDRKGINPKLFMHGMTTSYNKDKINGLSVVYKFNFTDINKQYYIKIANNTVKLLKDSEAHNTEIICDFDIWQKVANNLLDGSCAFKAGNIAVLGDIEKFNKIQNIFSTPPIKPKKDRKLSDKTYLVPLALIPFIVYWVLAPYYNGMGYLLLGTLYPIFIFPFFKPKENRGTLDGIERLSILTFVLYYILYTMDNSFYGWVEVILPIGLIISCIFKTPILANYSKYGYDDDVIKTNLFRKINTNITIIWAIIFIVQFLVVRIIFAYSPLANLIFLINILGMIFSYKYPKTFEEKIK